MAFVVDWFYDILSYLGLYYMDAKVLFLGLDNAGKTTLLQLMKYGRVGQFEPTVHAGKEELIVGSLKLEAHDLGGHDGVRRVWKNFFSEVDGVVFLVDAADTERFPEAKRELDELLSNDALANTPFLILGNKIDMPMAVSEGELRAALGLMETTGKDSRVDPGVRPIELFMCSIVRKRGYGDGFEWLSRHIKGTSLQA